MKYSSYKLEDFVRDEQFKNWVKAPTGESDLFWKSFIETHPQKANEIYKARMIIQEMTFGHAGENLVSADDKDQIWQNIIRQGTTQNTIKSGIDSFRNKRDNLYLLKFAAALLLPLIAGLLLFHQNLMPEWAETEAPKKIIKTAPKGQKLTIQLPDRTMVNLNAGSSIEYMDNLKNAKVRKVSLLGEAFFDVTKDREKPFVVHTWDFNTKVLGTSFNINAYSKSLFSVAVLTGKVQVSLNDSSSDEKTVLLNPTEQAVFNEKDLKFEKTNFNYYAVLGWKDGILDFKNADFNTIVRRLEIWYDVKFVLKKEINTTGDFTGRYQNKSLETILEGMKFVFDFNFKIENKTIIIYDEKNLK